MKESVDGIQSASNRQQFRRLSKVQLIVRIIFFIFGLGLIGVVIVIGRDIRTLLTIKSMLPTGHYLVLFQNNAELRPSGGFIGSFATVDIGRLGIERYMIDTNIYKRDNAFTDQYSIQPPAAFLRNMGVGTKWAMRDANWDLDFRDAAARTAWFYEQEGGEPVDGVIAINASVVQDVLRLIGPVVVPRLESTLTADSFFAVLTKEIEQDYFKDSAGKAQNEPKSVLRDLLPVLLAKGQQPAVALRLPSLAKQELTERQVQIFHTQPTIEAQIVKAGWGGAIDQAAGDYLLLNNASVLGMKSSLFVGQEADLTITTQSDGSLQHLLTIARTHTGTGVWPDARNNNYLRIAVPLNSQLSSATLNDQDVQAIDTTIEAQKTVFGIRFDTDPGHTSTLQVKYIVPNMNNSKPFELFYQKQSGTLSEQLRVAKDGQKKFDGFVVNDLMIR